MIDTGDVRIAENPEEAFWKKLEEENLKRIDALKHEIIITETVIRLAQDKQKKI